MKKNAKIGYFAPKPTGCSWYRVLQPMNTLDSNGVSTVALPLHNDIDEEIYNSLTAFQFYGATPFSCGPVMKAMKADGKKIIYDMDDALGLIEPNNPNYYSVKKDVGSMHEAFSYADEVTVSCPALRQYVELNYKGPITVIPNCYTPSEWTFTRPKREGIRIGFAGSSTHVKDLIDIIPVIERLKKKYPITFIIMGLGQIDYPTWYSHFAYTAPPEAQVHLKELDKRLTQLGDFEWVQFVDVEKYPSTLINMALDIGICPLKETPFDRCRTACKAMEYTLSGALALASDTTPYREDHSSVLVKDDEWEERLEFVIKNPDLRETVRLSHLSWLKTHRINTSQLTTLSEVYGVSPALP